MTSLLLAFLVVCGVVGLHPRPPTYPQRAGADAGRSRRSGLGWLLAGSALTLGVLGAPWSVGWLALLGLPPVIWVCRRFVRQWQQQRRQAGRRQMVLGVCDALAAELRTGLPAGVAVVHACADWPELGPVVATAELGGDVPEALRAVARRPGAEGLRSVAVSWEVSRRSGAALGDVLDRLGAGLRDEEEVRAEVDAALGPPRATAKMLALLPLMGLALGASIGADPLGFLIATPLGLSCLGMGALLAAVGLWWVERLARAVEA